MPTETRTTDAKARLILPKAFANATVILEQISETEIRIRRAKVIPEDELRFAEEARPPLPDSARDRFLELLADPPQPTPALKNAANRHKPKAKVKARRG